MILISKYSASAAHGNAIFSPILLQACINDFPEVVRTILRSGVINPNHFLTFQMLIDLFRVSPGLYEYSTFSLLCTFGSMAKFKYITCI